ncbi:ATP-grasp domain-containing protein [Actinocorallia longicatena]|uniref:ATP-grasp domain-containing protein n=1 Tax=Actinocorallia longicatena TaxID=111803 RepID=A0ABP6QGF6_9ACTN
MKFPALLFRTHPNTFHHGTLGAIRSLGRAGVEVHAHVENRRVPIARSRYLHQAHPWPRSAEPQQLMDDLARSAAAIGRSAVLIPMDDAAAIFIAENPEVGNHFLISPGESSLTRQLADKSTLADHCEKSGTPYPETYVPTSPAEIDAAVGHLGLPLIAKWARPWLIAAGSGQRSTMLIRTREQAHALWSEGSPASPLILQRKIAPEAGSDWFFQGYFSSSSRCLFGGVGRKIAAHPQEAGHTVLGEWKDNPEIEHVAHRLVESIGHKGLVDLDFRYDKASGKYFLLDFNPRAGAQFRLFTDRSGIDPVRAMHIDIANGTFPASPGPRFGRTYLVENHYVRRSPRKYRPSALARAVRRGELAWFDTADLKPFISMIAHSTNAIIERLRKFFPGRSG